MNKAKHKPDDDDNGNNDVSEKLEPGNKDIRKDANEAKCKPDDMD